MEAIDTSNCDTPTFTDMNNNPTISVQRMLNANYEVSYSDGKRQKRRPVPGQQKTERAVLDLTKIGAVAVGQTV